ncbi:hypothetical protein WJX73_003623 [Symbiochloris irregularis]|uniref:RWP-RK domain-containing protein n=1 Tax=Symbiochloris irregularis TaxID=706552 RepID=A0AAW1P2C4_9CHLO
MDHLSAAACTPADAIAPFPERSSPEQSSVTPECGHRHCHCYSLEAADFQVPCEAAWQAFLIFGSPMKHEDFLPSFWPDESLTEGSLQWQHLHTTQSCMLPEEGLPRDAPALDLHQAFSVPVELERTTCDFGRPGSTHFEPVDASLGTAGMWPVESTSELEDEAKLIQSQPGRTRTARRRAAVHLCDHSADDPVHLKQEIDCSIPEELPSLGISAGLTNGRQLRKCNPTPKWAESMLASQTSSMPAAVASRRGAAHAARAKPGRKRLAVDHINLELLKEHGYFDMPIQEAAQQLKIGLSVLKRICRQMGLARWPFRTRQSLRGVIAKTQEYYQGEGSNDGVMKEEVMQALHATLDSLKGVPGQGLSDSIRKYRQSVFKLNYKIKKRRGGTEQWQGRGQGGKQHCPDVVPSLASLASGPVQGRDSGSGSYNKSNSGSGSAMSALQDQGWLSISSCLEASSQFCAEPHSGASALQLSLPPTGLEPEGSFLHSGRPVVSCESSAEVLRPGPAHEQGIGIAFPLR